jgi:hypothetical protein
VRATRRRAGGAARIASEQEHGQLKHGPSPTRRVVAAGQSGVEKLEIAPHTLFRVSPFPFIALGERAPSQRTLMVIPTIWMTNPLVRVLDNKLGKSEEKF